MLASHGLKFVVGPLAVGIVLFAAPCLAKDLTEVVAVVEKSVVRIDVDDGHGSGVIVDASAGLVLTNFHVIDGARAAKVTLRDGKELKALGFMAIEPTSDLALLKIEPLPALVAVKRAEVLPAVGASVAAFGSPKGFSFSTTEGIVSAVRGGKEVSDIIGDVDYRALGYGRAATWIQTSAAISGGNSGGPLVNMEAELVGINTWSDLDGQNLNFAIALPDIERIIANAPKGAPQSFADLPQVRSVVRIPDLWDSEPFRLDLPTGRVFSFAAFQTKLTVAEYELRRREEEEQGILKVVMSHPSGVQYAVASQRGGVLHGNAVAQYDNREQMVHAQYDEGKRHGTFKIWNEDGKPLLYSQYVQGRRHGFLCFFEEDHLAMICQYKGDQLEYLQLMHDLTPLEGFATQAQAQKDGKAAPLLKKMAEVDKLLLANEAEFKRQVRKAEMERRKALAAKLAPEKRRRMQERATARDAANDAFIQEIYRRANGGR